MPYEFLTEKNLWTSNWFRRGMLCVMEAPGKSYELKNGGAPPNPLAIGCGGWDIDNRLYWVGIDLDVGHGKTAYETTPAAIEEACKLREFVNHAAEIRHSKSGAGIHIRVKIAGAPDNGRIISRRIATWLTKQTGILADPSALGRQNLWLWAAETKPHSFELILEAQGEWTPPAEAMQEPPPQITLPIPLQRSTTSVQERARRYLAKIPGAVSGQGGHDATFHAACILVKDFDLSVEDATPLLQEWNTTCAPPWDEKDLLRKLTEAKKARGEHGRLLKETTNYKPSWCQTEEVETEIEIQGDNDSREDLEPTQSNWPNIETSETRAQYPRPRPPVLIEGLAFASAKISFTAPSKARKTFTQMHLGICVAAGIPWHEFQTVKGRVLYINLELNPYSFEDRERAIYRALQINPPDGFDVWHLRGLHVTIEQLQSQFARIIEKGKYALICIDPLYKVLAGRNENAANEMADLLNRLEAIGHDCGAALLVAHHFTKGNAAGKEAIDRAAGSGVIGRDADAMITLTPHEEDDCFSMECVVRDFSPVDPMVLRWTYPLFSIADELDPENLKQPGQKTPITDAEVLAQITTTPTIREKIQEDIMAATGRGFLAARSALGRVIKNGLVKIEKLPRPNSRPILRYYKG